MVEKQKKDKLQKNDFIKLEFTGKTRDGTVFDTNLAEQAKKLSMKIETRPLAICVGQGMILPSIDEFLVGKTLGKYKLELTPDKAFGVRKRELVKTLPISVFKNQQTSPYPGMMFQFDALLGRISAVSGGRVIVDFNNPLAGKEILYDFNIKEKITNLEEKLKALISFFFRKNLDYKLDAKKIIIQCEKGFEQFVEMFRPKFKEILDLELEVKVEEKKKEGEIKSNVPQNENSTSKN